ncbi:MAG TPA: ATP-binding protein [Gemmatimonadaceae bacterium]|nr:ATP-binding protein [Gemmatimonadaceae bacterium]
MGEQLVITVLVVDDTVANRWVVTRILEEGGYRVVEGGTSAEAMRFAKDHPDLIVLDIRLPDGNGFDIARQLKSNPDTASIPLLLLSASFTTPGARAQGLDAGADGYLTHPVEPAVLLATVRALLRTREAEAALRESESRFRQMADTAPVMIWLSRADGGTEWVNRTWLQFTGKSLHNTIAEGIEGSMHADDRQRHAEVYRRSLASRQPFRVEYRLCRNDGDYRWVLDSGAPRFDDRDTFSGFIGSVIDITERKLVENERESRLEVERAARTEAEALRIAAEQANVAKAQFLAAMSHELRTPLNAIAGYVDLLEMGVRGQLNRAQLDDLGRIRRNQRHLLGVINNILNFAKVEAGHVDFQIDDVPVDGLLEGISPLIEPQREAKRLSYRCEVADTSLIVRGDSDKVQQILLNLLSNAIKFTPPGGGIVVRAERFNQDAAIRVQDTGRGIPAEKLDAIFEPFVQVDQHLTREGQGTGLGLAISRELARAMGGDLTVVSELGRGAEFTLTLPIGAARPLQPAELQR